MFKPKIEPACTGLKPITMIRQCLYLRKSCFSRYTVFISVHPSDCHSVCTLKYLQYHCFSFTRFHMCFMLDKKKLQFDTGVTVIYDIEKYVRIFLSYFDQIRHTLWYLQNLASYCYSASFVNSQWSYCPIWLWKNGYILVSTH